MMFNGRLNALHFRLTPAQSARRQHIEVPMAAIWTILCPELQRICVRVCHVVVQPRWLMTWHNPPPPQDPAPYVLAPCRECCQQKTSRRIDVCTYSRVRTAWLIAPANRKHAETIFCAGGLAHTGGSSFSSMRTCRPPFGWLPSITSLIVHVWCNCEACN